MLAPKLPKEIQMTRKETALASLDIVSEGLAQEDGLAERLTRQRSSRAEGTSRALQREAPASPMPERGREHSPAAKQDRNAWRQGKALLQVAIPSDAHIELSVLAKRRRMPLSQLVKGALNLWLETHSHTLRIGD
jgi:hypothetical protein